ncbi:MAG: TIGR04282 family arsenosugar biosynthesis glycosyltransferase [Acetobacteraceae bacterium]|nr:TIGR04282 family arsenosugar biosynthesis glycosyltransferase [Acetobacteraceae bacterium]
MAKLPRPGAVKTRLSPPLSPAQAAGLAAALLRDSLACLAGARGIAHALAIAGDVGEAAVLAGPAIAVIAQRGDGLSARMLNAAADLLAGSEGVLLFGADTIGLCPADLEGAAVLLAVPGERIVLGPSEDGGFWLIGMKRANPLLFDGMRWSHPAVLPDLLAISARLGLPVGFAPRRADCDTPADLVRAAREGGPATRAFLAAWRGGGREA